MFQKDYHAADRTKKLRTIWLSEDVASTDAAIRELKTLLPYAPNFATAKPERLLKRIIEVGSRPGDLVLDCFLGSGTRQPWRIP